MRFILNFLSQTPINKTHTDTGTHRLSDELDRRLGPLYGGRLAQASFELFVLGKRRIGGVLLAGSKLVGMVSRLFSNKRVSGNQAADLPGRSSPLKISGKHLVLSSSMVEPFPDNTDQLVVGMGCFWGVERLFWTVPGVYTTAAGYAGGSTTNPTYEETCSGRTGHTEAVLVVFEPERVALEDLLKIFWENHDPTQKDRQGNDVGSQYRSALFASSEAQLELVKASVVNYQSTLSEAGFGTIQTEVALAGEFYYAEEYHQQYLAKNPNGYCNHGFCQVAYIQE